jgi:ATP-dependent Clp protease ATP-binding subunit ClpA
MIFTLLRKTKNNPLLIWEAWVWKTAVVEWFATRIIQWKVPEKLKNKKVFLLDMWSLLAGTKYRWEFESRLKTILEEASDPINNIILFIDEIHTIIWAGNSEWWADAANMLKPMLARWKVKLIWATTFDEYQKHIEKDPALKRRFQEVNVLEPSFDVALLIMNWLKKYYEEHHWVQISDDAILSSIQFSKRYILNKQLPDKAIDLLDEACARKSVFQTKLEENNEYLTYENDIKKYSRKIRKIYRKTRLFLSCRVKKTTWRAKKINEEC